MKLSKMKVTKLRRKRNKETHLLPCRYVSMRECPKEPCPNQQRCRFEWLER